MKSVKLSNNFSNVKHEHDFRPCRIEGEIPKILSGTLYRNGPGIFERFGVKYQHWFGGQGVVHGMRFHDGKAESIVKIVKTQEYLIEEKAGKALYNSYGTRIENPWYKRFLRMPKNAANTSVLFWKNKLYALEEGHLPTELNPDTLATLSESKLGIAEMQRFSAHPHWVSDLACGFNFGVASGIRPKLQLFKLPASGEATLLAEHTLPGVPYIHDFIATNTHLIFFIAPIWMKISDFLLGKKSFSQSMRWHSDQKTQVWIIPIESPEEKTVIEIPPCFVFHFANAYNANNGEIWVDYIQYDDFSIHENFYAIQERVDTINIAGQLTQARINLQDKTIQRIKCSEHLTEFPIIPPEFQGKAAPFIFSAFIGNEKQEARIIRHDTQTMEDTVFSFEAGVFCSEPIFVNPKGTEVSYILTLVYDGNKHESFIAILNAMAFSQGILAKVFFEYNVPLGFHGRWVSA